MNVERDIITDTNLHHHLTQEDFAPLRLRQPEVVNLPRKRLAVGAATIVWALVHPELDGQGGRFIARMDIPIAHAHG